MIRHAILFILSGFTALVISGCSMTAGGDMSTTTQVNPTVSPDIKFNNAGGQ